MQSSDTIDLSDWTISRLRREAAYRRAASVNGHPLIYDRAEESRLADLLEAEIARRAQEGEPRDSDLWEDCNGRTERRP